MYFFITKTGALYHLLVHHTEKKQINEQIIVFVPLITTAMWT